MSDVGQNYRSWSYDCETKGDDATKIDHDNAGITHTFMEVDNGAPIRWKRPSVPKDMESQSKDIGKPQQQDTDVEPFEQPTKNPDNESNKGESKSEAIYQPAAHKPPVEEKPTTPPENPSFQDFEGRDVCTEQLELLIDEVFDGKDGNKSFLAYCLDAQRKRWELSISRSGM